MHNLTRNGATVRVVVCPQVTVTCPHIHSLKLTTSTAGAYKNGWDCDGCKSINQAGSKRYCCMQCTPVVDFCTVCFAAAVPAAAASSTQRGGSVDGNTAAAAVPSPAQPRFGSIKSEFATSEYRGVSWKANVRKWFASLSDKDCNHGKSLHIGTYTSEMDAALAYDATCKRLGLFHKMNFESPDEPSSKRKSTASPTTRPPASKRRNVASSKKKKAAPSASPAASSGTKSPVAVGSGLFSRRTSAYRGVSWQKSRQTWEAYISVSGRKQVLGESQDEGEAARIYDKECEKLGLWTKMNFSPIKKENVGRSGSGKKSAKRSLKLSAGSAKTSKFRGLKWKQPQSEFETGVWEVSVEVDGIKRYVPDASGGPYRFEMQWLCSRWAWHGSGGGGGGGGEAKPRYECSVWRVWRLTRTAMCFADMWDSATTRVLPRKSTTMSVRHRCPPPPSLPLSLHVPSPVPIDGAPSTAGPPLALHPAAPTHPLQSFHLHSPRPVYKWRAD